MIEVRDTGGMAHLLNTDSIIEAQQAPGDPQSTRVVMRNGAEYRLAMTYAEFRARVRTLLDRMLPIDRQIVP